VNRPADGFIVTLNRLELAREFMGTNDPLDFFRSCTGLSSWRSISMPGRLPVT